MLSYEPGICYSSIDVIYSNSNVMASGKCII